MTGLTEEQKVEFKIASFFTDVASNFAKKQNKPALAKFLSRVGIGIDTVAALVDEHPVTALVGVAAGIAAVVLLGPLIEGAAAAVVLRAALIPVLNGIEGAEAGALFESLLSATGAFFVKEGVAAAVEAVDEMLREVAFPFANGLKFAGSSYNIGATDPRISTADYTIITSQSDPKTGQISTTIGQFFKPTSGTSPGQVDVLLPERQFISFQKGSFSQLVSSNGTGSSSTFTAFLLDEFKNRNGSLKIDRSTNDVRLFGTDGSVEKLGSLPLVNGETQLEVSLAKSGATLVNVLDAANGGTKGQLIVDTHFFNNGQTIDSNITGLQTILGTGVDTLFHSGAKSVIDVGASDGAQSQYELTVGASTLIIGKANGDSISLAGTGFVKTSGTLDGTPGNTALIVADSANQTATGGAGHDILVAAGTHDTLTASQTGQTLIALGESGDVLNGELTDTAGLGTLIALDGNVVGGPVSHAGNDTLKAGVGDNVLVGEGVATTFSVDANLAPASLNIIWGGNDKDTFNFTGKNNIYLVNIDKATLQSVLQLGATRSSFASYFQSITGRPTSGSDNAATIIINPIAGDTFVLNGQTLSETQLKSLIPKTGDQSTIITGDNQTYTPKQSSNIVAAVGNNIQIDDPFSDSLLSFGSNNKLNYTGPGKVGVDSTAPTGQSTNDTISAGDGNNVLIGNGTATTFKVDTHKHFGVSVIWNQGGAENIDITGNTTIFEISSADATLKSVEGLNVDALMAAVANKELGGQGGGGEGFASAEQAAFDGNAVILINPTNAHITVDGRAVSGGSYGLTGSSSSTTDLQHQVDVINGRAVEYDFHSESTAKQYGIIPGDGFDYNPIGDSSPILQFNTDGIYGIGFKSSQGDTTNVYGFKNGDLGINFQGNGPDSTLVGSITFIPLPREVTYPYGTISKTENFNDIGTNIFDTGFFSAKTPDFDLSQYQGSGQVAAAFQPNGVAFFEPAPANAPTYTNVVDQFNVFDSYVIDTLVNRDAARAFADYDILIGNADADELTAFGAHDTLIAGGAQSTLKAEGSSDVLISNGLGSTLDGSFGQNTIAAYTLDDVTVDLGAGTATVNNSGVSDTLIAITGAAGLGSNDTLIGGASASSLYSDAAGNTLIAGTGGATAIYAVDDVTIDLTAGTAVVAGQSTGDTLIGIAGAAVSGAVATIVASGVGGTLTASGSLDTLLDSGSNAVLIGAGSSDLLISSGDHNSLIATAASNTLVSHGTSDTLFGNGAGSTLDGSGGTGVLADYGSTDYFAIDLSTGTARPTSSGVGDTLIGIHAVHIGGTNDTLVAGSGADTLIATGTHDLLFAGTGAATLIAAGASDTLYGSGSGSTLDGHLGTGAIAAYAADNAVASLASGQVSVAGALSSDVLIGINGLAGFGSHDTLIASSGSTLIGFGANDVLISAGSNNTLIDNYGTDTLISTGQGDTLFGSGFGSVLDASGATGAVAVYSADNVTVDLSAGTATTGSFADDADHLIGINSVELDGDSSAAIGGSGGDVLLATGNNSTLIGGSGSDQLVSTGEGNTLIAQGGADTLLAFSDGNTLFGNAAGSTLDASEAADALAAYAIDNVTIDLAAGTASVNGSGLSDTLIGFSTLTAFGAHDTLIGGSGASTLIGQVADDTLVAGTGSTLLLYKRNDVTVNLGTGTAVVMGSALSDTIVGLTRVTVSGSADTVIAASGNNTLTADGMSEVLIAGTGNDVLTSTGLSNTLIGGSGASVLSTSGVSDTLIGGSGANTLSTSGSNSVLIAGSGADTLTANGFNDTLIGNGGGSTLIGGFVTQATTFFPNDGLDNPGTTLGGTPDTGTVAAYSLDNVTVDLSAGTAGVAGSGSVDTLLGIADAEALGSNDTLIGSNTFASTLTSNAHGNTLIAGTAGTVARYAIDGVVVDLTNGSASLSGSGASDVLIGITAADVDGHHDTLIGSGSMQTLLSSGENNTLIASTGAVSLVSSGTNDTLIGNGAGSSLIGTDNTVAAYTLDDVTVDLTYATATINGSTVSDTLNGIRTASALGTNDTLIAQYAQTTLISNAAGNTLIGNYGAATIAYLADDVTVDLVGQTATVNGSGVADSLIGVLVASVSGIGDTLISDGSGNTLIAGNSTAVVDYAVDDIAVDLGAGIAAVAGAFTADALVGVSNAVISGVNASAKGGNGSGTLRAVGDSDTLIAGGYAESLIAAGAGDTLIGNVSGSVLDGTLGTATTALYESDQTTVNLATGLAISGFDDGFDTLVGIHAAAASGIGDTLIASAANDTLSSSGSFNSLVGGSGVGTLLSTGHDDTLFAGSGNQTLISEGNGNTLIAGSGADLLSSGGINDQLWGNATGSTLSGVGGTGATAVYGLDGLVVDLAGGTAGVAGAGTSDSLQGISSATVYGEGDTIIGGSGDGVLSSHGSGNTLMAGSGSVSLASDGTHDVLVGGSGIDTLTSSGFQNTLAAHGTTDVLTSSGADDLLVGGGGNDTLLSSGENNTLIAGTGVNRLTSTGINDTLFGNGGGSTLDGAGGSGTVAVYAMNNVTVDLVAGMATINGSGVSDTLVGISSVLLSGSNDTLIGGTGAATVYSDLAGNTIVAGAGQTTVVYTQDDATIDLATSSATVNGSTVSDTLVGIRNVTVSGSGDTIVGGAGGDVLSSSGLSNTLIGGTGADSLSSSGQNNVLIAGSAADTLISSGFADTLVGNAAGSILDGTDGTGTVAAYAINNVKVDLAAGTAKVNGSGVSDTMLGITTAAVSGINDTLIGGSGATTLLSNAAGNTLEAGTGQTTVVYAQDDVAVDLANATATVNGSSASDTLIGITHVIVAGSNDTLIGGSGADVLSSSGEANTLIAGTGANTLSSSGFFDTLRGNASGSTLDGTSGAGTVAEYAIDNVTVDLAAGTAKVNGSSVADVLLGITSALASGTNDTLIGSSGATTLFGNAGGNTLVAGSGQTVAAYSLDHVVVNLGSETAAVSGSSASDTLIGITSAAVSGINDIVLGGSGTQTLISSGSSNTLTAGSGANTLLSSGIGDTLIAGTGADVLSSSGFGNSLVAGTAADSLISTGEDDTLFGNAAGSTLDASTGFGAVAAYALDHVTIDLSAGTAGVNGSGVTDTLIGINSAQISGSNDTLIGNSSGDTLGASGSNDVVEGGTGADNLIIDSGTNTFFGGGGLDTFIVQSASIASGLSQPQNLIGDFDPANETIDLSNISGVASFADLNFSTVSFGTQSYLQVALGSSGEAITLSGVTAADLSASNFVFGSTHTIASPPVITSEVLTNDTGSSQTDYVTNDGHVSLTGTVASGSSIAIFDGTQIIGNATVSGTGWTFSTDLGAGTHQLSAAATDAGGSTTTSAPAATIVVDTAAPQPAISGMIQGQSAALVLNGTSETGSVVRIFDGTTLLGAATADASGLWSFTTGSLVDELHTFSVTASDLAGNVGSGTGIVQYGGSGVDGVDIATTLQASNFVYDATNADWHVSATGVAETLSKVESVVDGAGHRFLLVGGGSRYATIQAAVRADSSGDTILIAPGSYTENVAIAGKALSFEGFGGTTLHGSITETGTLNGALTIDGIAIDATGQQYGVFVSANSTGFAGSVTLDHASIANARLNGFAYIESGNGSTPTHTDTVGSISILNSVFSGNATQTTGSNGRGDILLYGYNGNFTANGVTIESPGAGAQKAIQLRGVQTSANTVNVGPYQSSGDISLTNLNVSGTYTQDLLAFYRYSDLGSFSASGVTLNAAAPWGLLNFDEVGGTVDLSNGISATNLATGAPVAVEQGLNSHSTFVGTSGNDVLVSNGGTDTLVGGAGNNTYVVSPSTGQATIYATAGTGTTNQLNFVGGITDQKLWFEQSGNDLKIDLLGTSTEVDVNGWFANTSNQLQEITAGGLKIDSQVSQLVQAMATYSANNPGFDPTATGNTAVPSDSTLQSAIASAWHT